jgi:hypothetical protein
MPALSGWHIENSCSDRQPQQLDQSRRLLAVALRCEKRPVLQEIVGVER